MTSTRVPRRYAAGVTVTCPACGLSFETAATTNTRCRRCRKVVNISSHRRSFGPSIGDADEEPIEGAAGWVAAGLVAALIVVLIALGRRG